MDKTLHCIIVEDEPIHSNRLKKLLATADKQIKIVAICTNIEEAVDSINKHSPELVFLDIQLQGDPRGGFELLKQFSRPAFDIVFTTAHIDKNILGIRRCGIGYLAKPYIQDELDDALSKVGEKQVGQTGTTQLETLLHNLVTEQMDEQLLWLNLTEGNIPVKIKNLIYCKANNEYTVMYIREETENDKIKKIITSKGIGVWTEYLTPLKFCRCHDSHLINLKHITKVFKKNITLKYIPDPIPMSDSGKERLDLLIKKTSSFQFR